MIKDVIYMRASEVRTDNYIANYRIRTGLFLLQYLHMHASKGEVQHPLTQIYINFLLNVLQTKAL